MKIQFIVCGWWYDEFDGQKGITDFIDGLVQLQEENENIDVFWSCHKEPTQLVKDNFKYKVFKNVGLEWGAYDQAFKYLKLDDDVFCFFIQDDIIVHDWNFVSTCIETLTDEKVKIIGNGFNYPSMIHPSKVPGISLNWIDKTKTWVDYVRDENKHIYDTDINAYSMRGSFFATKSEYIKEIGGLDYVDVPLPNYALRVVPKNSADSAEKNIMVYDDTEVPDDIKYIEKMKLTNGFGNTTMYLNAYKFTKFWGIDSMRWMSNRYRKSKFMTECGNGQVELPEDSNLVPFDVSNHLIVGEV